MSGDSTAASDVLRFGIFRSLWEIYNTYHFLYNIIYISIWVSLGYIFYKNAELREKNTRRTKTKKNLRQKKYKILWVIKLVVQTRHRL